jgi:hypothetical protein
MSSLLIASSALKEQIIGGTPERGQTIHWFNEMVIVLLVMLGLTLLLVAATYLFHRLTKDKRGRTRSKSTHKSSHNHGSKRRRRRRSRRKHPTLAETGGLPPKKVQITNPGDPSI